MDLEKLRNSFFDIADIFAERQKGDDNCVFERKLPRSTEALILFTDSTAIYSQQNRTPLHVPHGALVYLPRGSVYTIRSHSINGKDSLGTMYFSFLLYRNELYMTDANGAVTENSLIDLGTKEVTIIDFRPKLYEHLFAELIDTYNDAKAIPLALHRCAYAIFEALIKNCDMKQNKKFDYDLLKKVMSFLTDSKTCAESIKKIASRCYVSVSYLEKQFKKYTGITPNEYRMEIMLTKAQTLLINTRKPINVIADEVGFYDSAHMHKAFKAKLGVTPKEYVKIYGK